MRIFIVDDDNIELERTESCVRKFFSKYDFPYQIECFQDTSELFNKAASIDLLFLDIELLQENGVDVARKLKSINKLIKLIFVSKHSEYLVEGYKVNASRYFIKPINQTEFELEMRNLLSEYINENKYLLDVEIAPFKIYYGDIYYVEILRRHTFIHAKKGVFKTNYTLQQWMEKLSDGFFAQNHRAFFVNLAKISAFNHATITLNNDEVIPLSRSYREKFIDKYMRYLEDMV